ncbi:MAG: hypothetical protein OER22_09530 [Gammaproteobacteria bacterium]|nr:hypothetical protein [Gammaproteobacteria bacterium]
MATGAQTTDSEAEELDAAIDEITVVGARQLGAMRAKVELAEDQVFALFNDLNDDDGYDIICKKETRIGSQLP